MTRRRLLPLAAAAGGGGDGVAVRPSCATLMYAPGGWIPPWAAGDWLSGRAPRSHRGGHWFDPSIAHLRLQAGCLQVAIRVQ